MINIFRKLRRRLLAEHKFTRYLLYAIGEIVLVVIGILIALQINNWNQGRLNAAKEDAYLENLERDLQNQLSSIDLQLEYEQKYITLGTVILDDYYATDVIALDSTLSANLSILTERKTFVRTDPTFEDMLSTGNIGLLRNNGLRNALIEYYQELERIEKVLQNNNTLHTDQGSVRCHFLLTILRPGRGQQVRNKRQKLGYPSLYILPLLLRLALQLEIASPRIERSH